MYPLMIDTKWDELRRAMHGLHALKPRRRTGDVDRPCWRPYVLFRMHQDDPAFDPGRMGNYHCGNF